MRIETRVDRGVAFVEPKERLTVETVEAFGSTVRALLQRGVVRLALSLAAVPYVDSSGLGAIIHAYTSARRRGGDLKLLHVTGRNRELLAITKLLTVFETYDEESAAEHSFLEGRPRPDGTSAFM